MINGKDGIGSLPELAKPASAEEVLVTYEAINSDGEKLTGAMPNNGPIAGTIDGLTTTSFDVPAGYTSGGTVSLTDDIDTALAAI